MDFRVSVVLPFRNAGAMIGECLESVLNQTLREIEIVAVNDGSTDPSAEVVRRLGWKDSRLRLLEPGRIGFVAALNLGIGESRAPLIARMDADDIMQAERLALQAAYLDEHPDVALVSCRVALFPAEQIRNGYKEYERWQNECLTPADIADNLYVESPHAHPSVLFRRNVVRDLGGYREGPFPEDYDLWLRMTEAGYRTAKIPRVLLHWRERPDRMSRTDPRYSRDAFDRLRAEYLARDRRIREAPELVFWGAGRTTRKRVQHLLAHGVSWSGWVDIDPRKIGKSIWGHQVHPPQWLDRQPRPFVLIYVTNHGAREEIATTLESNGYRRGIDYLAVG